MPCKFEDWPLNFSSKIKLGLLINVMHGYWLLKKQTVVIFRHNIDAWSHFTISKYTFAACI